MYNVPPTFWGRQDSNLQSAIGNHQPTAHQARSGDGLLCQFSYVPMVLGAGLDPATFAFSERRCYQLSYPSQPITNPNP
jgi:hypothetical protein